MVWVAAPKSCKTVETSEVIGHCPENVPEEEQDACFWSLPVRHSMETWCEPSQPYNQMFWILLLAAILSCIASFVLWGKGERRTVGADFWHEGWGQDRPDRGP
jgi:hypothetical protein